MIIPKLETAKKLTN